MFNKSSFTPVVSGGTSELRARSLIMLERGAGLMLSPQEKATRAQEIVNEGAVIDLFVECFGFQAHCILYRDDTILMVIPGRYQLTSEDCKRLIDLIGLPLRKAAGPRILSNICMAQ